MYTNISPHKINSTKCGKGVKHTIQGPIDGELEP